MPISVFKYKCLADSQKDWAHLYNSNDELSPCCSFDFSKAICSDLVYRMKARIKPEVFGISMNGNVVMIAALAKCSDGYRMLADCNGSEYNQLTYSKDLSIDNLARCIRALREYIHTPLIFNMLPSWGGNLQALNQLGATTLRLIDNATIRLAPFGNDHSTYIASLSKNARQNLRTAYNRLQRDGYVAQLHVTSKVTVQQLSKAIDLYSSRHAIRYGISDSWLRRFYLKHFNYSTKALQNSPEARHAILTINGELAAFMMGYERNGRWIIPRLSVDDKWKFYSPGILLIDKVTEWLQTNRSNPELDLALGNEPYKYQMGATTVKTAVIKL